MITSWKNWGSQLALASCVIVGGAIASANCALAQITPDSTLPNNSRVTTQDNIRIIEGGTQAGGNLFHSFQQFSVPTGGTAYFNNTLDIQNIISRVTGSSISNIDGLIRTNGTANLFLINPNGIIFGPNASLNIGGSFVATTANTIEFGNQGFFSADNPNTAPLLTVNPSAFLFNQIAAQPISNQSYSGLKVPTGRSLVLLGGDVRLEEGIFGFGGFISAPGGRVELGGLAGAGTVGLNVEGNNLRLSFPDNVARANVSLTNEAVVNVDAGNGGSITINAGNLNVLGGSFILAGIREGLGSVGSQAGDITLNATGTITVADSSTIYNNVEKGAVGNAGNINITAGSLSVRNGAGLYSYTAGQGDAGNVIINARDVSFDGKSSHGISTRTGAFSTVEGGAIGNGGNIRITTGSLSLSNFSELGVNTTGKGNSGNINIKAEQFSMTNNSALIADVRAEGTERGIGRGGDIKLDVKGGILLIGGETAPTGESTRITLGVQPEGIGSGGDLNIKAGSLVLKDGAFVKASSQGQGSAGNIQINADVVDISGSVPSSGLPSGLFTNTDTTFRAGNISVNTQTFRIADGAVLSARSRGNGQGGDIRVNASSSFEATNGGQLVTTTFGKGQAGNISINATDRVTISGSDPNYFNRIAKFPNPISSYVANDIIETGAASGLFTSTSGTGKGGNIDITTRSLSLTDGAFLNSSTFGKGDAGSVNINARDMISFDRGYVYSTVEEGAIGKGGDIRITTGDLSLTNGAQLNATTYGKGDGGSVIIDARKSVSLDGVFDGRLPSAVFGGVGGGEGKGGGIHITTDELSVTNGAQLQASTGGKGDAGNVIIDARKRVSFDGVIVGSYTFNSYAASRVYDNAQGQGGNIQITTDELSVTNGAQVFADTSGKGNAGNIQINAKNSVSVSGTSLISGSSSALFTFTNSTDKGGNIIVDTSAFRTLDGGVLNAQTFNDGDGGSITVRAKLVEVLNGGQLLATSSGNGRAGKITVNAADLVIVNGSDATYLDRVEKFGIKVANAFGTKGVNNVNADSGLFVRSESLGSAGDIEVTSPQIRLDNQGRFIAESASGNGGNITLGVGDLLLLRRGSLISATAGTDKLGGNGGNITINAPNGFIVAVPSENSDITANAFTGNGGRVQINASGIYGTQFREKENPQTSDITASSTFGANGTVELNTPDVDLSRGLVNLPAVPVDTKVAQGCTAGGSQAQSEFIITGRGGLPPNPGDALSTDAVQVDLITLNPEVDQPSTTAVSTTPTSPTPDRIVEATGWVIDADRNVVLTANAPTVTPHSSWQKTADCRAFNQQPGG